eukprot:TRINITY_DN1826_c0_g1_i3.p1 TRINITY_DN1826_c0_g1~~TRINITY_DN1826_c0_g1_i3.p1  ORF type:complete len:177 (+),score=33.90 TRINITY_DN1826_c0_g1_i3:25-531(+)
MRADVCLAFVFSLHFICTIIAQNCTYTHGKWSWDLSPLISSSGTGDWSIDDDTYKWHFNVCGDTLRNPSCPYANSAYYTDKDSASSSSSCVVAGITANETWSMIDFFDPRRGPSLNYTTTEPCSGMFRSTKIDFVCDASSSGYPSSIQSEDDRCQTTIQFNTKYACTT